MTDHEAGRNRTPSDLNLIPSLPAIRQTACPLFTLLPAEIRNHIYTFTLESDHTPTPTPTTTKNENNNQNENENENQTKEQATTPYRQNAFYYRPGYNKPSHIQTALLQTCQQIYTEASLLPPAINEHTFCFYRPPPHVHHPSSPLEYFRQMAPKQREQVRHIHLFTQHFFLENNPWSSIWDGMQIGGDGDGDASGAVGWGRGRRDRLRGGSGSGSGSVCRIAPRKLTITFRHTDWWFWEDDEPLGIDPFRVGRTCAHEMRRTDDLNLGEEERERGAWGRQFVYMPCLEELVIEFETVMRKREQLDGIIERALEWKFPLQPENGLYLVAEPNSRSAWTWVGAKEGDLKNQPGVYSRFIQAHAVEAEWGSDSEQDPEPKPVPVPVLKPFIPQAGVDGESGATASGSQSEIASDREEYYVIFLTWKKQQVGT
jgi:hypothetical protein